MSESTSSSQQLLQQMAAIQLQNNSHQNDEVNLAEVWKVIWKGKLVVIAITLLFAIISLFYALSLPNVYKSEALLAPAVEDNGGLGGMASQLGGLASLAGINIGSGGGVDKTTLALEIMKSRAFVSKFIEKHELLIPLIASKGWSPDSDKLIYDDELYSVKDKEWVRKVKAPLKQKPSAQEAYKEFSKVFYVSQDKTNSMINISIKNYSPTLAQQWIIWLVDAINLEMKTRDLNEAQKSIDYLEQQLNSTKVSELHDVLYQLIEEQTKIIMFANVREQYAFKTIDPAIIPELKHGPKRLLVCMLGALLGCLLSIMGVLIGYFSKK